MNLRSTQNDAINPAIQQGYIGGVASQRSAYNEERTCENRPESEIESAVKQLDEELQTLESIQRLLYDRLTPVLALDRPVANKPEGTSTAPQRYGSSGMGKVLIEAAERAKRVRIAISESIDLLAL